MEKTMAVDNKTIPTERGSGIADLFNECFQEFQRARSLHKQFNCAHEGYAVILEELDELWAEVKKRRGFRDRTVMRKEALQVAAMALRFIYDLGI
jgi:hypothetical protein